MRIIITGGPATGKSEISVALSKKLGFPLIDIKEIVNERGLYEKKGGTKIVDTARLNRVLSSMLRGKKSYVLEGHLACEMKLPADYLFVLRTKPKTLKQRYSKRKYPKNKTDENLLSEMLDYCTQRVMVVYGITPVEVETSNHTSNQSAARILGLLRKKKKKLDAVDYSKELKNYLRLKR